MSHETRVMEKTSKIRSFTDLDAWKQGHKLVLQIYQATTSFPREEQFGLVSQMRRAVIVRKITSGLVKATRGLNS